MAISYKDAGVDIDAGKKIKFNPVHKHEFWELIRLASGKAFYYADGQQYALTEGDLILIPPNTPHNCEYKEYFSDSVIQVSNCNFLPKPILIHDIDGNIGKLGKEVIGAGFDSGETIIAAVRDGRLAGAITQAPVAMGEKLIEMLYAAANGEAVADVDTGCQWYNAENIDNPEICQNLYGYTPAN